MARALDARHVSLRPEMDLSARVREWEQRG